MWRELSEACEAPELVAAQHGQNKAWPPTPPYPPPHAGREGGGRARASPLPALQLLPRESKSALVAFGVALGNAFERIGLQDENSATFEADPFLLLPNAQLPVCAFAGHADEVAEVLLGHGDLALAGALVALRQA